MQKSEENLIFLDSLPVCMQRIGKVYDRKPVMACGFREIEPTECIKCGGFQKPLLSVRNPADK
jgi:hypothetical protein